MSDTSYWHTELCCQLSQDELESEAYSLFDRLAIAKRKNAELEMEIEEMARLIKFLKAKLKEPEEANKEK